MSVWSNELPIVPGWYWYRLPNSCDPIPLKCVYFRSRLQVRVYKSLTAFSEFSPSTNAQWKFIENQDDAT